MTNDRRVKLLRSGRNQAVRIPRELELPGRYAILRKEADRLGLEPAPASSLLAVLATLETLDEDCPRSTISPLTSSRSRALDACVVVAAELH